MYKCCSGYWSHSRCLQMHSAAGPSSLPVVKIQTPPDINAFKTLDQNWFPSQEQKMPDVIPCGNQAISSRRILPANICMMKPDLRMPLPCNLNRLHGNINTFDTKPMVLQQISDSATPATLTSSAAYLCFIKLIARSCCSISFWLGKSALLQSSAI